VSLKGLLDWGVRDLDPVRIDNYAVCRAMGYKKFSIPAWVSSLVDSQIARAYELIQPAYIFKFKEIRAVSDSLVCLEETTTLNSKTLSYVLADSIGVLIFLVTIGKRLEDEAFSLSEGGDLLKGYLLDTIGSEAVEGVGCRLDDDVEKIVKGNGYRASLRYSPGYCDWDIKEQKDIFQAIDSSSIGVELTESCLMIPRKSISGIIGISENKGRRRPSPCVVCEKRHNCSYKRSSS